jgi:hypothetical protein
MPHDRPRRSSCLSVIVGLAIEHESERSFLNRIYDDLREVNRAAIILANFTRQLVLVKSTSLL